MKSKALAADLPPELPSSLQDALAQALHIAQQGSQRPAQAVEPPCGHQKPLEPKSYGASSQLSYQSSAYSPQLELQQLEPAPQGHQQALGETRRHDGLRAQRHYLVRHGLRSLFSSTVKNPAWVHVRTLARYSTVLFLSANIFWCAAMIAVGNVSKIPSFYYSVSEAVFQGLFYGWDSQCKNGWTCDK